jgi:hypothetical protein
LKQDSGRGTRGSDLPIIGALLTSEKYTDIKDVELGVTFAEQFDSLYPLNYSVSLNYLKACSISNYKTPIKTFVDAVEMLNTGRSAVEIYECLGKVKRFKELLALSLKPMISAY